jgi:hypothetical protein
MKQLKNYQLYIPSAMECPCEVSAYNKKEAYCKLREWLADRLIVFTIKDVYLAR